MSSPSVIEIQELNPDMIPPITSRFQDINYNGGCKLVVVGKPGCFAPGTPILLYNGTTKLVEDVKIGEQIMGDDSTPRTVLDLCYGQETMYKITLGEGPEYIVNENHILSLKSHKEDILDITVKDFLKKSTIMKNKYKWYRASEVQFTKKHLEIDPYIVGYCLLSKQKSTPHQIRITDEDVAKCFNQKIKNKALQRKSSYIVYNIDRNNIPKYLSLSYKTGSVSQRLELLAGLIDCAGSYDPNEHCYKFSLKLKEC